MVDARGRVEMSAAAQGLPTREFASTLLLFVATPRVVVAAQIGDGAIVIRDPSGELKSLTMPQNGEYANTTTFLVSPESLSKVQYGVWTGDYTDIAAFTDGLQRLALVMPKGSPYGPFFGPLFDFADHADNLNAATEELGSFLRSTKVTSRADDDLTLMLAKVSPV
jgi:hypothetical protein